MCTHTPLGVHILYTAPSLAVAPAAAQLWWRKLSLNVLSASCAKIHFATAEMVEKTILEFIWARCQSEWLFYPLQKLKSLLFPNLWIWSCGYVNAHMTSRHWNFSIKCHKCMSKPQVWSWYSNSSCCWRVQSNTSHPTIKWQMFLREHLKVKEIRYKKKEIWNASRK